MTRICSKQTHLMPVDKKHILNEIKRTTAENGGKALGTSRFCAETGIRVSDWKGIHWVRWSDALREADVAPNQFLWAHEAETLFHCYAKLSRELGRLPVDADFLMKRRRDGGFPNRLAFHRFGSKADLVRRVAE